MPLVSIVIPHYRGKEIIRNCLLSLAKTEGENFEVILVDNNCTDNSVESVKRKFATTRIVHNDKNLGFAGGCNVGIKHAHGEYVVLLNDDTQVAPDWLNKLVRVMECDEEIGACQPKILSLKNKNRFDYAGAAGGLIDVFGYPFARGRIFGSIEEDRGQYDQSREIFWASGCATMIRKSILDEVGLLDEDFFAHMEEIDLDWRIHLAGHKIVAVPQSVVYHHAASTLQQEALQKLYLNYRNSLIMLLKNYSTASLLWILPMRVALDLFTAVLSLFRLRWKRTMAVISAFGYLLFNLDTILHKRTRAQKIRRVADNVILKKMYRGCIGLQYFLFGNTIAVS